MSQKESNGSYGLSTEKKHSIKVLVAEDSAVDRTILAEVVRKFGYEVISVCDGLAAWELLQKPEAPQIALLDWSMPGVDGPELCRRLRARRMAPVLYVLLVTGRHGREDIVEGLGSGADDFISKPWNSAELQARINVGRRLVELQNHLTENVIELRSSLSRTYRLLNEQQLSIDLSRKLLTLTNKGAPRWINLNDDSTLHVASCSLSCRRAGGDHYWARTLPARGARGTSTTIAIRDQSGHEVSCILRSIATDLVHMDCLEEPVSLEKQIAAVNDHLCTSEMFAEDDFLTALTLELDHATLRLQYVSCGHPPMLLIRGATVIALPPDNGLGQNFPLGTMKGLPFRSGECGLKQGDRLLLYTDGLAELGAEFRGRCLSNGEIAHLVAAILEESPEIPVSQLVQRLLLAAAEGADFQGPTAELRDDVTVIGLEIEADGAGSEAIFHFKDTVEIDAAVRHLATDISSKWNAGELAGKLRQILDEALTNAWLHGNKQNPELPVRVSWDLRNGRSLLVEDAGAGFNPILVTDPCSEEGLLRENGRGVFMIKNLCEWAEWKKSGTRLVARLSL